MTTNSPNPVDGDVQALIADCQAEIAEIEKMLALWGAVPYLKSQLKRQQLALAALTADTAGPFDCVFMGAGVWASIPDELPSRFEGKKVYVSTAPPTQLLRPVELKDCEFGAVSHMSGGSKDYCNGFVDGTNNAIKAIREAGYEVKQ